MGNRTNMNRRTLNFRRLPLIRSLRNQLPNRLTTNTIGIQRKGPRPVHRIFSLSILTVHLFRRLGRAIRMFPHALQPFNNVTSQGRLTASPSRSRTSRQVRRRFTHQLVTNMFTLRHTRRTIRMDTILTHQVAFNLHRHIRQVTRLHLRVHSRQHHRHRSGPFSILKGAVAIRQWQQRSRRHQFNRLYTFTFRFGLYLAFRRRRWLTRVDITIKFSFPLVFTTTFKGNFAIRRIQNQPVRTFAMRLRRQGQERIELIRRFGPNLKMSKQWSRQLTRYATFNSIFAFG